jgi:hypothetical protein
MVCQADLLAAEKAIEPIEKPNGDSMRSGNNLKKPSYKMHKAMGLTLKVVRTMKVHCMMIFSLCQVLMFR